MRERHLKAEQRPFRNALRRYMARQQGASPSIARAFAPKVTRKETPGRPPCPAMTCFANSPGA